MPLKPTYTVEELQAFLEKDVKVSKEKPTLVLYGGEPLINLPFVAQLLEQVDANFVLQTNATLLDRLSRAQLEQFASILVSIDGDKETVDRNRGAGTYDKCIAGCKAALEKGRIRNLVARGCAMEGNDIFASAMHLLHHPTIPFTHFYWQLNVGFDAPMRDTFETWVRESYNPGITKLVNEWIRVMETEGKVMGIVPFLSLTESMLEMDEKGEVIEPRIWTGPEEIEEEETEDEFDIEDLLPAVKKAKEEMKKEKLAAAAARASSSATPSSSSSPETMVRPDPRPLRPLRCGIGYNAFSIATDGKIAGCPCGVGEKWNMLSDDFKEVADPRASLCGKLKFTPPCTECDIADLCGGRCTYCNHTKYWGGNYHRVVCNLTIRHLINELIRVFPVVKGLLKSGKIEREPFTYPAEQYSLEVIP
eukprot:MONOS_6460.1-p1 / transcript=MONOS_6460.1 / gene=MONOS_6460 / organism=Monocercomonoides_exilis_PA203 / gene_product=AstB / transcript_product=AstB / location=Mono_scaffold00203:60964-62223(-) / protein_length=419 / sequence_SO=supercontig / SO=protein_coding / is_pseudo=false